MNDIATKLLYEKHAELSRELDQCSDAIETCRKALSANQGRFDFLSEEVSKLARALNFLEENKEEWYDSNS